MTSRIPMTEQGAKQLKETLNLLKTEKRPQVIQAIAEARAHKDLKENAEYHAAKEQQAFIERDIAVITSKLVNSQVINPSKLTNTGRVVFGATVRVNEIGNDQSVTYQIVGEDEADIKVGKVSFNSPIGKALIGKQLNESVSVDTPSGSQTFKIRNIEYL